MAIGMNDLLHFQNLLLAKRKELSAERNRRGGTSVGDEARGDPVDMAANEVAVTTQLWLQQSDSRLWRAIEDALTRIRQERYGICEECGGPISQVRLEAVPWARHCKNCKEGQGSRR